MRLLHQRLLSIGTCTLFAAGCAGQITHSALQQARETYLGVAENPEAVRTAPVELYEAERALHEAETTWQREGDPEEVEHLAYIAEKRAEIAKAVAEQVSAEAETGTLGDRRTQVLLHAREREIQALRELNATQTSRGTVITLGDVLFEPGMADLKPGAIRELARLVNFLREHPKRSLAVEGHTDNTGADQFNETLSRQRAFSVKTHLVRSGIAPTRISARGYGEGFPIASNGSAAGRQRNRRVDLVILSPNSTPASAHP